MLEIPQGSEVCQENIYCISLIPHTVLLGFFSFENEINRAPQARSVLPDLLLC